MKPRLEKLQNMLQHAGLDAFFVTDQHNVSYLTGFSGLSPSEREGFLFLTRRTSHLITFPTYFGLYQKGGDGFKTLSITAEKRLTHHLEEIIKRENLKIVGFEKENLTIAELESLESRLPVKFRKTRKLVEEERIFKDKKEIEKIKEAAAITDRAFAFIKKKIKKGVSEKDLAFELEYFLKKNAGDIAFSPIVAFDQNAAIPHYIPSHHSQLTTRNLILLDFGAKVDGYCADMTRVVFWGTPTRQFETIYNAVLRTQEIVFAELKKHYNNTYYRSKGDKVEIPAKRLDAVARQYLEEQGFPTYPHGLGHGVGLAIHEAPRLKIDSDEILSENMVVTVEPGIYLAGECGVRLEDLVVLTSTGCEILSKSSKEITVL